MLCADSDSNPPRRLILPEPVSAFQLINCTSWLAWLPVYNGWCIAVRTDPGRRTHTADEHSGSDFYRFPICLFERLTP